MGREEILQKINEAEKAIEGWEAVYADNPSMWPQAPKEIERLRSEIKRLQTML